MDNGMFCPGRYKTEFDRIVAEGIVPSSFALPETICGYYVDEKRKKLWAIELDILLEIDRVCKKYNIIYFLFFGSLLGAIRHNGFIPWDDDLDVIMSRDNYNEFIKHRDEFKEPYFLQNCYTDPDFLFVHSRIRNCNTTAIQRPFATRNFNQGCFIDVLYYDNITADEDGRRMFEMLTENVIKCSTWMKLNNPYPNFKDEERIKRYDGEDPTVVFERTQMISQSFKRENTEFVAPTSAVVYGFERLVFFKEDFDRAEYVDFEGRKFPIPCGWDRILKKCYGDYRKMPPIESRGGWHGALWFDPDISYKAIVKSDEFKEWLKIDY